MIIKLSVTSSLFNKESMHGVQNTECNLLIWYILKNYFWKYEQF